MESFHDLNPVEKKILEYFVAGDSRAMELIYKHYSDALYGVAKRITRDDAKAADVLQDAFVKIWKKSGYYDARKGRLFTWMVTIVRNRAIDVLRSEGRRPEIHVDEADVGMGRGAQVAKSPMVDHDLGKTMELLAPEEREILEHAYILGFTHPEIAEKFGLPLGTVKTKIRNAMIRLRKVFGNGR